MAVIIIIELTSASTYKTSLKRDLVNTCSSAPHLNTSVSQHYYLCIPIFSCFEVIHKPYPNLVVARTVLPDAFCTEFKVKDLCFINGVYYANCCNVRIDKCIDACIHDTQCKIVAEHQNLSP